MSIRRILFFDFDDTLYSHVLGRVPEAVLERLRGLSQADTLLVVATGRGPESVPFMEQALGFSPPVLALLNGQLIWQDGKQVLERHITLPSMNAIIAIAHQHQFAYGGYNKFGEVVSQVNDRVTAVWSRFGAPLPTLLPEPEKAAPLYQGHLYITKEEAALFAPHFEDYLTNWSDCCLMNLIPRFAAKSTAVHWCLEHLAASAAETFAFGDGFNDVDLISNVHHGVAVGTASAELTAAAELVVPPASENGLLQALNHYHIV